MRLEAELSTLCKTAPSDPSQGCGYNTNPICLATTFANKADLPDHRRPRREYRWSKEARDLVRENIDASGKELSTLITRLTEKTGYPRWACRRFVRRMGAKSRRRLRAWTSQEQQRLLKLVDLHPVKEIAQLMRRSQSSVWHMLYRLDANARMGQDSFTKYTLAVALHVRPDTIESWIKHGWLRAREVETGGGKRVMIGADDFCEFCRLHTKDAVGRRLTEERLEFIYRFAFPPSHAPLLPVRESMKERSAYGAQMETLSNGGQLIGHE